MTDEQRIDASKTAISTPLGFTTVPTPTAISATTDNQTQSYRISSDGNLISLNASSQIPFKLAKNGGNFSSWKSQMTNLLLGYGHPLTDGQIMGHTLNGLGDEFKELKVAAYMRDTYISFEDLFDKLLDEEIHKNHGEIKEDDT
ncbi:hypothetical protein Ddye_019814 [Dipteronia dyeriana]|uniref:Retrotransposon Copia-like N-terminal domain-containing protein n=1 Tax=Dipteronia dyeriana TaxID=168575 RepID=A0AAD9TYH1_9ROSI|nr:hypothetical protein Ddye_019814 [Dipteronia dyeriana]